MTADAHPARPPRAPSRRSLLQAGSLVLLLGTQQIARGTFKAWYGSAILFQSLCRLFIICRYASAKMR